MKNDTLLGIFKRATYASLIALCVYLLTSVLTMLLGAFFENNESIFLVVLSFIYTLIFCYFYINCTYIQTGIGVNSVFSEYKDKKYSAAEDLKVMFRSEYKALAVFAFINLASWLLINLDKYLLGKRTVTALLIVYTPIQMIGSVLPSVGGGILGFLVATVLVTVVYIIMIMIFRKKWSK